MVKNNGDLELEYEDRLSSYTGLDDKIDVFNENGDRPFDMTRKIALRIIPKDQLISILQRKLVHKSVDLNLLAEQYFSEYVKRRRASVKSVKSPNVVSFACCKVIDVWINNDSALNDQKREVAKRVTAFSGEDLGHYLLEVKDLLLGTFDLVSDLTEKGVDLEEELKKVVNGSLLEQ